MDPSTASLVSGVLSHSLGLLFGLYRLMRASWTVSPFSIYRSSLGILCTLVLSWFDLSALEDQTLSLLDGVVLSLCEEESRRPPLHPILLFLVLLFLSATSHHPWPATSITCWPYPTSTRARPFRESPLFRLARNIRAGMLCCNSTFGHVLVPHT